MAGVCERYSYIVLWHHDKSYYTKKCLLHVYYWNTFDLVDMKTGDIFMTGKTTEGMKDKTICRGDILSVSTGRMKVINYGDLYTREAYESVADRTVGLMRADSIRDITCTFDLIISSKCKIIKMRTIEIQPSEIKDFFFDRRHETSHLKEGPQLLEGKLIAIEIAGDSALQMWRDYIDSDQVTSSAIKCARHRIYGSISNFQYRKDMRMFFPENKYSLKTPLTPSISFSGCTLALIKPHAVKEATYPKIIHKILDMRFTITAMKMHRFTKSEAQSIFHLSRFYMPEFEELVFCFTLGPCIGIAVSGYGDHTACLFRQAVGPRHPDIAKVVHPYTIRAEFGTTTASNAIYCTVIDDDAVTDCIYFFTR